MNPELLPIQDNQTVPIPQSPGNFSHRLNKPQIIELMGLRRQNLLGLKKDISLKLYYTVEEKLDREEKALLEILDWQEGKITKLSQYSLILDPHFFEQEFLQDIS
jgi:hypothetical protein